MDAMHRIVVVVINARRCRQSLKVICQNQLVCGYVSVMDSK